ncbi:MAG TPA: hypothetical protein VLM79_27120 [Kofleriaceae bacterium]|nr:hypothetical protein [Kofleriaceae bacterium]
MPRLGEHLVAAGLLSAEQVEQALRAQVMWGGRLGTNLVELHFLELDALSKALGRQHHLPAVLARHFEKADPVLQRMLSADFAERFSCVPVLRMGPERHVVIAAIAPLLPRQLAIIADELAVDIQKLVPAIAPELRIRYQLERVYNIRRAARFLRARGKSIPPFPDFHVLPIFHELEPELMPALPTSTQEMELYRPGDPLPEPGPPPQLELPPEAEAEAEADELLDTDTWPRAELDDDDDFIPVEVVPPGTPGGLTGPIASIDPGEPGALSAPRASDAEGALGAPDARLDDELYDLSLHAQLDDEPAPSGHPEPEAAASGRERRTYVRTLADAQANDFERQALLGRIAIRKVAVGSSPRVMAGATLGEATRAIRRSTGRDRVADLVIDTLDRFAPACEAAILLVVRGATAIGWKGFLRGGGALGEIAVPMEDGGLVPRAVELNVTLRKPCSELDALDRLLLASLGKQTGDLVVVPISIGEQVMCVIAIATPENAPLASAEPIAAAAGAAFARLMRDASR